MMMYSPQEIELLKIQLLACYGSYISILVRKTGLSRPTIAKFFNDRPIKWNNQNLIYQTGYELVLKKQQADKRLARRIKQLVNHENIPQHKMNKS